MKSTAEAFQKTKKAPPEGEAKCLKQLAGGAGIEPAINGLNAYWQV
jgi:hypothetical protein